MAESLPNVFDGCYIEDPRILSEQVLNDGIFNGSLTFPYTEPGKTSDATKIYTVPFIMENNFSFKLGNDWGTLVPEIGKTLGEFLSSNANLLSYSGIMNGTQPQVSLISRAMSAATWKGSEIPTFQISLTFVATRRSYNPVKIIKALAGTCLPLPMNQYSNTNIQKVKDDAAEAIRQGATQLKKWGSDADHGLASTVLDKAGDLLNVTAKGVQNAGLIAPLFYEPHADLDNDTVSVQDTQTVTLQVGQWFRAPKLLVNNISNIEFSKETIAPQPDWLYEDSGHALYHKNLTQKERQGDWGFPLYAKCTIDLRPTTYITYNEFLSYFPECPHKADNNFTINDNISDMQEYTTRNTVLEESHGTWFDKPTSTTEIFNSKYSTYGIYTYDNI